MTTKSEQAQGGFSLLELVIVMALLAVIAGGIFLQINTAQQRAGNEGNQLDLFQESREFMDQMSRDLRQVGYPTPRNFYTGVLSADASLASLGTDTAPTDSGLAAVGLIYADATDLWFEGGLDDNGTPSVYLTQYHFDSSTTNGCPCLRRSQRVKVSGQAPTVLAQNPNYSAEVQNVQNYGPDPVNHPILNPVPIFTFFSQGGYVNVTGVSIHPTLPICWDGTLNSACLPSQEALTDIDTVMVQVIVQSPIIDLKTGVAPTIKLVSTVRVNNCMQYTTGQLSCTN